MALTKQLKPSWCKRPTYIACYKNPRYPIQCVGCGFVEGIKVLGKRRNYTDLINEEKNNPQEVFNKTFHCPYCGHGYYEHWKKIEMGEIE